MTVELLRKFVDVSYLRNDFEYEIRKVRIKPEDVPSLAAAEPIRGYHGYRAIPRNDSPYLFKPHVFVRVKETEAWRRATDARKIGGQLGILALTNPVVYLLTTAKRVAEAVLIVAGIFFDTFAELYPQKTTNNLTKAFIACLNANLEKKKKECQELWDTVKNDFHCAAVMELAAIHGLLNVDDATRMQFLFGDKERQWNRYKEAEAFKHIEVDETALFGVTLFFSKCYKTVVPLLWTFMVKEGKKDRSPELTAMILESRAYTEVIDVNDLIFKLQEDGQERVAQALAKYALGRALTIGDTGFVQAIFEELTCFEVEATRIHATQRLVRILTDAKGTPVEWLENVADHISEARVKGRDIEILTDIIGASPKFQAMGIRELTSSSRLKFLFLAKYFFEIAKMHHTGFIQYQCAYPFSDEKQIRIEALSKSTTADSIEEAWEKFNSR